MSVGESRARASAARALGWFTLMLGAVSLVLPWTTEGIGKRFAIASHLAIATLVLGLVAVLVNRGALRPRSRVPVIALMFGIFLVLMFAWMIHGLAHLGTAH